MITQLSSSRRPQLILAFCGFILIGAQAGASGVLIPGMIAYYHVDKSIISFLFLANSVGYFLSASLSGPITQRLGQRWYLTLGVAAFLVSALAIGLTPPFPALVVLMVLLGFGAAVLDAGLNAFVAAMPRNTALLNFLHAFFGTGALIGPIIASTALALNWQWNTVYLILCVMSLPLLIGFALVLRDQMSSMSAASSAIVHEERLSGEGNLLMAALKMPAVWLVALFLFIYVGVEITMGNWGYSFLLEGRHQSDLVSGWMVSGFWAGLTLGRFILNNISERLGLGLVGMVYSCIGTVMLGLLMVLLLPGEVAAGFSFCLIGFGLGPLFPTAISLMPKLAPGWIASTAIGFLVGLGVVGGAIFPSAAGILAQYAGIWWLMPFSLALTIVMGCCWWTIAHKYEQLHVK